MPHTDPADDDDQNQKAQRGWSTLFPSQLSRNLPSKHSCRILYWVALIIFICTFAFVIPNLVRKNHKAIITISTNGIELEELYSAAVPWWWHPVNSNTNNSSSTHDDWNVWTTEDLAGNNATIQQFGQTWHTANYGFIAPIKHGIIGTVDGMVYNDTQAYTFGKWYWENDAKNYEQRQKRMVLPTDDPAEYLSLLAVWDDAFQHIIFDTLPKLVMACPFLHHHPRVQVLVMNNLQRDLVRELCQNVALERFHVFGNSNRNSNDDSNNIKHPPYQASAVYVPHFERYDGTALSMGLTCSQRCLPSLGPQYEVGTDILYLPRAPGTVRSVANEDQVLAALRRIWPQLRVFSPTNHWPEDRKIVERVRVIIGPHGGALANLVFAPVNTSVIELTPLARLKATGENERPCYFGLAHALGFNYYAVEPSQFDFDSGPMVVPVDRVTRVAKQVQADLLEAAH